MEMKILVGKKRVIAKVFLQPYLFPFNNPFIYSVEFVFSYPFTYSVIII